jgi:hypothetical protein
LAEGEHCYNGAHLLAKFNLKAYVNKDLCERVIYFSSVNEEGEREEIVM